MRGRFQTGGACLLVGLLVMGLLVVSPQGSGAGREADYTLTINEDSYLNLDNQNQVPVAVNNSHSFSLNIANVGDVDEDINLEATFTNAEPGWDDTFINIEESGSNQYQIFNLNQGDDVNVTVDVTAPPMAELGQEAELEFTATGASSGASESLTLSVAVRNWTAYITGFATFARDDDADYTVTVVNLNQSAPFEASRFPIELRNPGTAPGWDLRFYQPDIDRSLWPENITHSTDLAAGESVTYTINLKLDDDVLAGISFFSIEVYNNPDLDPRLDFNRVFAQGLAEVLPSYGVHLAAEVTHATVDSSGGTALYNLTVQNTGNTDDSFSLVMQENLPAGWSATLDKEQTGTLSGDGGKETAGVTITAPAEQPSGTPGTVTITATSDTSAQQTSEITLRLSVAETYGVSLTTPGATTADVIPGQTTSFAVNVNNLGNVEDTITLAVEGGAFWLPVLEVAGTPVDNLTVNPFDTGVVLLKLTAPADALHTASSGEVVVNATSSNEQANDTLSFTAFAAQTYDIQLTNATNVTSATKAQGQVTEFSLLIDNRGNGQDRVNLSLNDDAPEWAKLMAGASEVASIEVNPRTTITITLKLVIPATAAPGEYVLKVTGTSEDPQGGTRDTFTFTLTVTGTDDEPTECPEGTVLKNGQCVQEIPEEEGGLPGFSLGAALAGVLAALGLLGLRRRS